MEKHTLVAAGFRRAALSAAALALIGGCTTMNSTQSTFDGTQWQVVAIDGRATPESDTYRMQFEDGHVGGRFGCNQFGGSYTVSGSVMTTSNVIQTLMGCPEPAATFEQEGTAVLNQPMRIAWQSDSRVTLSNAEGSIALERLA